MELLLRRGYRVASSDVGPRGELRPSALMGLLEDAAGAHAAGYGVGVRELQARGLAWVLARYHLQVQRAALLGEELAVATWPSGRTPVFATRDFEVTDPAGAVVARATTSWAVIDVATKRPRRMSEVVDPTFVVDRRAIADRFEPLPAADGAGRAVEIPVLRRDLDMNVHVNHAVYVDWALEAAPPELAGAACPAAIEVAYLAEARLGDRVLSSAMPADAEGGRVLLHRIANADTGAELARLRTTWRS